MRYRETDYDSDNKILAGVAGLRSPVHITLDETKFTAGTDGLKCVEAGFWVSESTDNLGRVLPRAKTTAAATTTDSVLTLDNVQPFVATDELYVVPASVQVDLGAAWAIGDTLTVTVAGLPFTYTAIAAGDAAAFGAAFADAFNANPATRRLAQAIAGTTAVTIVSADYAVPHTITVAATGSTATIDGGLTILTPFRALGTVQSVDVANNTLTLTAPATVNVAEGVPVGTGDKPIGFHLRSHDFEEECGAAMYTSLSGKRGAFPYLDAGLEAEFVEIQAVGG